MYHASPTPNRDSILGHGLDAARGECQWPHEDYPDGTYLFVDRDEAIEHAIASKAETGVSHTVYAVDTIGLTLLVDPLNPSAFYTTELVGPQRLTITWPEYAVQEAAGHATVP